MLFFCPHKRKWMKNFDECERCEKEHECVAYHYERKLKEKEDEKWKENLQDQ